MWAKFGQLTGKSLSKLKPKVNKIKGSFKKVGKKALNLTDKYPMTTLSTGLVAGAYAYSNTKSGKTNKKKLISEFQKLPKSDPRYKSLKKAGYI